MADGKNLQGSEGIARKGFVLGGLECIGSAASGFEIRSLYEFEVSNTLSNVMIVVERSVAGIPFLQFEVKS